MQKNNKRRKKAFVWSSETIKNENRKAVKE